MTGKHLQTIRRRLGVSQVALAAMLGVPHQAVTKWEMDLDTVPATVERLIRRIATEANR